MSQALLRPLSLTRIVVAGAVAAGVAVATVAPIGTALAASGGAATTASPPAGNVIVILRDQHTNLALTKGATSPRVSADRADQSPLLSRAKSAGARNLHAFTSINGFSATVTKAQAAALAADPNVAAVVPDLTLKGAALPSEDTAVTSAKSAKAAKSVTAAASASSGAQSGPICPSDPAKPILEPEALGVTNTAFSDTTTPQAQNLVDGTGVKVAYIADGIDINNPDFIRADGSHVFLDYQDFSGEGPNAPSDAAEAFGDASAIAAQGRQVYDLSNFVNPAHPLPAGCNITIRGVAPGASLIGLKVFGNANSAPTSRFIEAIDYAVSSGVDVLNESFGGNPFPDTNNDPITLADLAAVAAGVTVVASTGDAGTNNTVGSPASSGGIIGAAASTTFRSYAQTDNSGFQLSNGTWVSNNISGLSSGGTTQRGGVPDITAPGDLGWALCSPNTATYEGCTTYAGNPSSIQNFGGTSQASPLTSGAAALVIEAYENTHHGVRPAPALVKQLLTSTATDLGEPSSEQGAGLLNTLAAVQAAESWKDANGSPSVQGNALVVNKSQIAISGNPGVAKTTTLKVTNLSGATQTVSGSTRSVDRVVSSVDGTTSLNTATAPFYVDAFGISRSYVAVPFTVGTTDHLVVSGAGTLPAGFGFRVILIEPDGAYAAYSIPQGGANYTTIDVRQPQAGNWTAYFAMSKSAGFNGPIAYNITQSNFAPRGTLTPAHLTLAAGKSGTFTVHTTTPAQPKDIAASVQLVGSGGVTTSVPMVLRASIPPQNYGFTGTLTGGNGRQNQSQANYYNLQVPKGKKDLSIGFTFNDPGVVALGVLTGPDGQVSSFQSNVNSDQTAVMNTLQMYARNPQAGTWLLDLWVLNPVSGLQTSSPFSAKVAYNTVRITAKTLPHSASTHITQGTSVTVPVTVKNTSAQPMVYFADPRLTETGTINLSELSGNATTPLPVPAGVNPLWLVPSELSQLTEQAVADQPVNADFFFQSGNPDVYAAANGNGATVQINANQVSPGIWVTDIGQTGPFPGPAPAGTVTASVSGQGRLFDLDASSDTGDVWTAGVITQSNPSAMAKIAAAAKRLQSSSGALSPKAKSTAKAAALNNGPMTLQPGQTGTIMVTITPTRAVGKVVSGDVFIDTWDGYVSQGDETIALPYSYTIG